MLKGLPGVSGGANGPCVPLGVLVIPHQLSVHADDVTVLPCTLTVDRLYTSHTVVLVLLQPSSDQHLYSPAR